MLLDSGHAAQTYILTGAESLTSVPAGGGDREGDQTAGQERRGCSARLQRASRSQAKVRPDGGHVAAPDFCSRSSVIFCIVALAPAARFSAGPKDLNGGGAGRGRPLMSLRAAPGAGQAVPLCLLMPLSPAWALAVTT